MCLFLFLSRPMAVIFVFFVVCVMWLCGEDLLAQYFDI